MSPAHMRAIFGGFAALLVGFAVNTLLLQPKAAEPAFKIAVEKPPRIVVAALVPPPAVATAPAAEPPVRIARLTPDATTPPRMPVIPEAEGDTAVIRRLQKELATRGYGPVVANGAIGPLSRAAIMAWEHDNNLPLTGEATDVLLKRITDGAGPSRIADPQARKIRSPEAEQIVRTVQHSLTTLGYEPGRIDGRVGEETERAIRRFEGEHGIAPTGRVSAELFSLLARAIGARSSALR